MKNSRFLLAISFILAICSLITGISIINSYLKLQKVVVTTKNILPGEILDESDLRLKDMPSRLITSELTTDLQGAVGKVVQSYIATGNPIPQSLLMPSTEAGTAGELNSYPNRLAIGIEGDIATTAGYSIIKGNRVNIVAIPKQGTIVPRVVARDIPVLSAPSGQQQSGAVVLALTEQEIFSLYQARQQGDDIQIALEPAT
jgi:Flp pilus assembly protein CpaB